MCLEAAMSGGQPSFQAPPKVEPESEEPQPQQAQQQAHQQAHQQAPLLHKATSSADPDSPSASRSASPMEYPTDASVLKERYSQMHEDSLSQDPMDSDTLQTSMNGGDTDKQITPKYFNGLDEMDMSQLMERNPFIVAARHRYSMLGAAAMSQDTSKLLRGILQSKEKRLSGAPLDPEEQEIYAKMQERAALLRHTSFDTDFDSMPSGTPGDVSEDSDQENQVSENNYENSLSDDGKDKGGENENGDVTEVKRARVDSIINNLHMSPYKPLSDLSQGELRRPKRKQYIPQQHDGRCSDEPNPKVRKVEEEAFKCQLKFMQQQLSDMQQKYLDLLDTNPVNGAEEVKKPSSFTINGIMERKDDIHKPSPIASLAEVAHNLEPSHFFKTANKMVKEQEIVSKTPETAAELDHLAKMLKQEISSNINTLVDSIVGKFIEKQKTVKKVVDKQPLVNNNNNHITATQNNVENAKEKIPSRSPTPDDKEYKESGTPKPPRTKVTDKILPPMLDIRPRLFQDFPRHPLFPPPPYFGHLAPSMPIFPVKEPEQTEAMSLVISTPKKKRTKVTDTRLSPRAARALLQDGTTHSPDHMDKHSPHPLLGPYAPHHPALGGDFPGSLVPVTLPTSVAIPNPSLQHSEVLAMYTHAHGGAEHPHHLHHHHFHPGNEGRPLSQSPLIGDNGSPNTAHTPSDSLGGLSFKTDSDFHPSFPHHSTHHLNSLEDSGYEGMQITTTLTPMHLRKAKLMFFYVRYPSSAIIKMYFPDVKFNKNNTAQLVKWFSNFREFYYIQMEKYARQALAEGVKSPDDLVVSTDSELYRVLNLHYNRNNQIEVPESFAAVIEQTLREFFKAVQAGKDTEQSWKKSIYKVIARLDDQIPDYFKSPNWMETLNDM